MQGEYITSRRMPKMIAGICARHGITLTSYSNDWVLRLQAGDITRWIVGYTYDINSAGSVQVSSDKVAGYEVMRDVGIPCIEHYLVRSRALSDFIVPHEIDENARVVAKPLASSGGLGVMPCDSIASAKHYIMGHEPSDWALSPRYDITSETRIIMLDQEALLAYTKTNPRDNHGLAMFNLGQGAHATVIQPDTDLLLLAKRAQAATGLRACAVDIAHLADGRQLVMEINSGYMMEHFARQSNEHYQLSTKLYEKVVLAMMSLQ